MDPHGAVAEIEDVHHALGDVFRTGRMLRQSFPSSIPTGLFSVLLAIDAMAGQSGNPCHGKDLAARCALDPSTVSRSVSSLVALDLVRRDADPVDGRASLLALTPRGLLPVQRRLADRYFVPSPCESNPALEAAQ